jgi:DNA polymerase-1
MAVIQPKAPARKSVIQKGTNFTYNPLTFAKEHKVKNFFEVFSAEEMIQKVKPLEFMGRKFIFFDTETYPTQLKNHNIPSSVVRRWVGTGKAAHPQDFPFCISICDGTNSYTLFDNLENKYVEMKKLSVIFDDPTIEKVAHNAKFDMHMFANIGMRIVGKIHDTVVIAKLANENRPGFKLVQLAEKLPTGIVKFEYMVDAYKKQYKIADYRNIAKELLTEYANADVWNCCQVFLSEYPVLIKDELISLYENELELMIVLWDMERTGMLTNPEYEAPLKDELQKLTDEAEQIIYDTAGGFFNINSGKQLYQVLLKLGVDQSIIQKSDKGNPVLDKEALNNLAEKHGVDIVVKILEFRKYEKLLGTYANGIYDQRDSNDRVHGSVNQTEATTGRMSITKPALQTLPKKDKRIRKIFVPAENYELWFMDLDQVEYRLFAHYAHAQGLIDAIKNGWDVHQATASIIYNVLYNEVTEEMRTKAKTVNFSLVYGQGDEASANSLKMSKADARRFKDKYFANIPEARPFIDQVQRITRTRGYIMNKYGRRRRLNENEVYKAPNALIQGCAADYIKHKLVRIYKFLKAYHYLTRMINIVHDEVIKEVHINETFLIPKLRWILSEFEEFRAPITAGIEKGNPSWGQKIEPEDVGFEPTTPEGEEAIANYNVFDGSVFDR